MYRLLITMILLTTIACSCRREVAIEPLKFTAYEHNPILTKGPPGSWDELFIALPNVVLHNGIYYMYYMGCSTNGVVSIGFATSSDGYNFQKFEKNPVLSPDGDGFDAFGVAAPVIIRQDSIWVMHFNAIEASRWGPGTSVGRAVASEITGPWIKDDLPVLTTGTMDEWDAGFVAPCSIVRLKDDSFRMYYSGGVDFSTHAMNFIGMAISSDGITWKKYNDPSTDDYPFQKSDPILLTGEQTEWDGIHVHAAFICVVPDGYRMYYTGTGINKSTETDLPHDRYNCKFGFASSPDGIHWQKYPGNPFYDIEDDLSSDDPARKETAAERNLSKENEVEGPNLVFNDTICLMYYDYGPMVGGIGVAVGGWLINSLAD
jgi:predicted GH43/DUF377 family glycosyl hydrolase